LPMSTRTTRARRARPAAASALVSRLEAGLFPRRTDEPAPLLAGGGRSTLALIVNTNFVRDGILSD
jgi:hypothetical protein